MKTTILVLVLMLCHTLALSQPQLFTNNSSTEAKYERGVVLVKFKDDVEMPINKEGRLGKLAATNVQEKFTKYGIVKGETLFKKAKRGEPIKKVRSFSGNEHEAASLYNIFRLHFDPKYDAKTVAEDLSKLDGVIYAEPDFIVNALETIPNDPYYNQQGYLSTIKAPAAWDTTKGDTTQIIGILDTGVDWDHPDLIQKNKINWQELNGISGVDDDGNGYVDDIRGWDFINNDNNPNDDNSHGTHVAGIAAARTDNNTGVAGVSWGAKILPVKILQSTGHGSASTVAQGVDYARILGATVINLSLGTYSESITLRTALENAYSTAVLVASAGNDDNPIEYDPVRRREAAPMFPACYGWVIGVEATKQTYDEKYGYRATFSNYDPSGPVSFTNNFGYNYELKAPGVLIYNTLPNGQYGSLSGTSMAAPMVSGAVTLLKSHHPGMSNELLLGNLINGLGNTLDIFASMNQHPTPNLQYISHTLIDTLAGGDRDNRPDAGETIQIWLTVQNTWGDADSIWTKLRLNPLEDPSVASITDSTSFIINGLSTYATATGEADPFIVQLASDLANNRQIGFNYEIGCKNSGVKKTGSFNLTIQKGQEISGVYIGSLHLTEDNFYIVSSSAVIDSLIIDPGCEIHFAQNTSIYVNKFLFAQGTPEKMILFTNNGSGYCKGIRNFSGQTAQLKYCIFEYGGLVDGRFEDCIFRYNSAEIRGPIFQYNGDLVVIRSNFIDNNSYVDGLLNTSVFENNVIVHNNSNGEPAFSSSPLPSNTHRNNIIFDNKGPSYSLRFWGGWGTYHAPPQYYGTTKKSEIEALILDFFENDIYPVILGDSALTVPPALAHGIVWEVLLNGKNPHEETLDPIGIETVRFDVRFNRSMDTKHPPIVTFGVREPFTQHMVEDSTGWSSDSTMWHGYYTMGLETGDGINTVRVSGAKDTDHFDIPIEDTRFKLVIDAAGSAANEFLATADVGKVILNWPKAPTDDVLGYNMYRYYNLTDSTYSSIERINTNLITDTMYIDYSVIPDTTYHYQYKILGTDMVESDYSKTIVATPIKASSGDANGDLAVNVLDIMSIVSYILGQNPQPFLLEASDINDDSLVNVLDIIGVVNIILGGFEKTPTIASTGNATIELTADQLNLSTDVPVAGIQFKLRGSGVDELQFIPKSVLGSFEVVSGMQGDSSRTFILFSMSGAAIQIGQHTLGTFSGIHSGISITEAVISNSQGQNIITSVFDNGVPLIPTEYYLSQNYPNPFNSSTKILYGLPERSEVKIYVHNILGQQVKMFELGELNAGRYEVLWEGKNNSENSVASGIYFYRFVTPKYTQVKKLVLIK
ncbi:MAG: S8 family serine peptidase [Ignavibacteriales bacterium]|nr:S8 family serine peptidase [Ignavibacteriales bacterium]